MKKTYVLDTNVLLIDPQAIYQFEDNQIVIPMTVLEEIDKFKRDMSEIGRNARLFSRIIDNLRFQGQLSKSVPLPDGGDLRVEIGVEIPSPNPYKIDIDKPDNQILFTALHLQSKSKSKTQPVILVSRDINLRIKANAMGIQAEDYESDKVDIDEIYSGTIIMDFDGEVIDSFYTENSIDAGKNHFYPNQYILLRDKDNPSHSALGRYIEEGNIIIPIKKLKEGIFGIISRNMEQAFTLDALLDPKIQLVTLVGKAGTGKTLMAIAAGLQSTLEYETHKKMLISRPVVPMGKDIGYLPGDIEEKLKPWMQPIFDNMDLLLSSGTKMTKTKRSKGYHEFLEMGIVDIEPLTYIRGRSIPNQFIIVDEAQNLTPHEIKTIVTRVGVGTKIVFTGDPYQIDNPYVDSSSNGLSVLVEKFKNEAISAHILLKKGERSALAEKAANIL
ncbi:MAG: PhoH family protein [Pseudomonadota bacterium]